MIFAGYTKLATLLDELNSADSLYLSLTTSTQGGMLPVSEHLLMLSSPTGRNGLEVVRYFALRVGAHALQDGTRMRGVRARGEKTLDNVQALLAARNLRWSAALVAMPIDHTPLHGDPDPLSYNKQADCWLLHTNTN